MISLLKTWSVNLKSLYFTYWSLWLMSVPLNLAVGTTWEGNVPFLFFTSRLPPMSSSDFLWSIVERGWEPIVFIKLRLLLCRNSWLLLPRRPIINECSVNSGYRLQAENISLIRTLFSSVSADRLVNFIQSVCLFVCV